ncbi:hypothetical protein ACFLVG_01050 [Chloroflexota bacterium]
MVMWKLKGCPRCGGDLLLDKDLLSGWYEQCLQCSFNRDLQDLAEYKERSDLPRETPIAS